MEANGPLSTEYLGYFQIHCKLFILMYNYHRIIFYVSLQPTLRKQRIGEPSLMRFFKYFSLRQNVKFYFTIDCWFIFSSELILKIWYWFCIVPSMNNLEKSGTDAKQLLNLIEQV